MKLFVYIMQIEHGGNKFLQQVVTTYKITCHHNMEDHNPNFHYCENIKSHILIYSFC
jgi:hypothetical protein